MLSVVIDVSKGTSTVCVLKPYGEVVVSPCEIEHTAGKLHRALMDIDALTKDYTIVDYKTSLNI